MHEIEAILSLIAFISLVILLVWINEGHPLPKRWISLGKIAGDK